MEIIQTLYGDWIPTAAQIKAEMVRLAKEGRGPVTRKDAIEALKRSVEEQYANEQAGELHAERIMNFVMGGGDPEDAAWALATGWA